MATNNIISRGYVLLRPSGQVSQVVPKSQAERMAKRFGGRINVAGLPFRTVKGARVLIDPASAQ